MKTKKDDIQFYAIMLLIFLLFASLMWFFPWNIMIGDTPLPKWESSLLLFLLLGSWGIFGVSLLAALFCIGNMVYIAIAQDDGWYFNHDVVERHKKEQGLKQFRYTTDLEQFDIACQNFPEETPEQIAFKNLCQTFYNEAAKFLEKKTLDILQVMKSHLDTIKSTLPDESEGAILSEIKPMLKRAETLIEQAEELIP